MKRFHLIVSLLLAAGILFPAGSYAQEAKKDNSQNCSCSQKAEKSNSQNCFFVQLAGGVNTNVLKVAKPETWGGVSLATEVNVGKWWSPSIGTRIGWHGLWNKAVVDFTDWGVAAGTRYAHNYFHADCLWNISNTIGGDKPRFWNFAPYASVGLLLTGDVASPKPFLGVGVGLLNIIRINDRLDATLDLSGLVYKRKDHDIYDTVTCCLILCPSATVGIAYKF